MDRHPNWLVFLGLLFAALAGARGAAAQAPAPDAAALAEARVVFAEGLAHSDRHEWAEAVTAFRRVMQVRSAPPVLYNLAVALTEVGGWPEAHLLAQQVVDDAEAAPELRAQATALAARIQERAGFLTLTYEGDPEGTTLFVGEYALPAGASSTAQPVPAGVHTVRVERDGAVLARREVQVARGQRAAVALAPPDAVALAESAAPPEAVEVEVRRRPRRTGLWIGIGVGLAAVAAVVIVAATTSEQERDPFRGNIGPGSISW